MTPTPQRLPRIPVTALELRSVTIDIQPGTLLSADAVMAIVELRRARIRAEVLDEMLCDGIRDAQIRGINDVVYIRTDKPFPQSKPGTPGGGTN